MQVEFEAKAIKINKDEIRKKLKKLGAKLIFKEREFTRMTFETPELREKGAWIRLRDEGDKVTLTLKMVSDESSIHGMRSWFWC